MNALRISWLLSSAVLVTAGCNVEFPVDIKACRKAPADKRTPPSDQSLHSWDAPDWSILDDRRGELPDFPLDCLSPPVGEWVEPSCNGKAIEPPTQR